jgi:hypothetical protein
VRFRSERPRSCYCVDRDALDAMLRSVNALFDPEAVVPDTARGKQ